MKIRSKMLSLVAISTLLLTCTVFVGCDKGTSATQGNTTKAAKGPNGEQTVCPITKEPITNKALFVDKDGKRIYVSDKTLSGTNQNASYIVKNNFDAIAKQMEADGIVLAKTQ